MNRERILKRVLSLVLSLAMMAALLPVSLFGSAVTAYAAPADASAQSIASGERKIKINEDWRFCLLDKAREMNNSLDATASRPDYTESGTWDTVQLPHDWSIYQQFSDSDARPAQGSLAGGTGWYRKAFTLSDDMKGKNVVLQFDAVQMVSQVWINGHDLGKQFLGYVTFEYDITDYLRYDGQENVIAVKAYSSKNSARWYAGAGIYGSVYLIATEKVHIPVNGVHVATVVEEDGKYIQPDFHTEPDMDALKEKSTVNVRTSIENKTGSASSVSVNSVIYSKENPEVAKAQKDNISVPAGETVKVDQLIDIVKPALWSVDEPNLYWVKTEIIQDGRVVDTLDTRFGIRYLYLKPGTFDEPYSENNTLGGLFINGEYTRVNGVCEHRDLGALGMETYQTAVDRRIRKLKSMGVNVVRCAHDPVSPEYIEAADRLGMLIFEEGFDQWIKAKNSDDYHNYFNKAEDGTTVVFEYSGADGTNTHINWVNPDLKPNCVRDIQAMVDRDKNSPAIFLWSTGNEIYDSSDGHGIDTQWLLSAAVKEIDSLDNIPYTNIIDKETMRTVRPEPEENHAALPCEANGYKTDYNVRGGGNTVEGGAKYGARYGRPISAAPPTWDTGSSKVTRKYGFIDNMAMADIGGHNYSRANNQYPAHKNRYPNSSVVGTETVSAFYTRGVYNIEDYRGADEEGGRWAHASGYASEWPYNKNFTSASISIREHRDDMMPYLFGEMVWTGHDYLGEPTPHSSPSRSSYFGIIDTAGFEKDAFYMYRSAWTDIPTVHLLPQNWNWDMGTQVPIMVYTNAASVEVFINGKSIGVKEYNRDTAKPVYLDYGYQDYQAGELKAVAKNAAGEVIAEDVVYTAGEAQSVVLSGEKAFIKNDGSDLLYVEATVVDSAGNMVPDADNRITFHVEGGEIVALDNGDPRDREPFRGTNNHNNSNTSDNRKAFNGKALAIIKATGNGGARSSDIIVSATASSSSDQGQLSSNTLDVETRDEIGDGTNIVSYDLAEITTGVGVNPMLPDTIGVVYDDGLIQKYEIDSWNLENLKLGTPGTYTVSAVSDEIEEPVETKIHVKGIASIDEVEVTTIAGVEPPLPNFVTVRYTDGETGSAQVAWEAVAPAQYAEEGVFDVTGEIGPDKTVNAEVSVKAMMAIEEIAVSTERGVMPTLPSTVEVEFTDGSKEQVGVKWDISDSDIRSAGVKKITGTVLSSEMKAVVWLNVSTVVYASDLQYQADAEENVFKDTMTNGESLQARGMQGGPGEVYSKGFGTQAPAEIVIDIAGKGYERFRSMVNLSLVKGGVAAPGTVAFKVFLDDETQPVFSSGDMDRANEAKLVDIDVTGRSKIRLVTESKSGKAEDDLADWVNARFLSAKITIDEILTPQLNTANANEKPQLPDTVQASVAGIDEPVTFNVDWLTPVSDAMFVSGSVQTVYGRLEGAAENLVAFKYMVDYAKASQAEGFDGKVGAWSVTETFDYSNVALNAKVKFSDMKLTPKLILSGSNGMLVENVQNYGFAYGIYPDPNGGGKNVVFAAPNLSYFQVRNVANTSSTGNNDISNNNSFTFETSVDGENWTAFTGFTKGDILPDTGKGGIWAQRDYTSNEDAVFPEGTKYLRVTYPNNNNTWQYNMTQIVLKGGESSETGDAVMAGFAIGDYAGVIDQDAKTVTLPVPSSLDITSVTPEIVVSEGASISPSGPQDFSSPVTYTVTNGATTKEYVVTVNRGVTVSFDPYGGTIGGSTKPVANFIASGGSVLPPADPEREGYLFGGWTTDRASKEAMEIDGVKFTENTTYYAIWNKDPRIAIRTEADASGKTWQSEKNTNYGSANPLLVRQPQDVAQYGKFGEKFTNTSTSDGTDMKTAFIRFDVSELKSQNVKSVQLALHYAGKRDVGTNDIKLLVTKASSNWDEFKMTWNTRPALLEPENIAESEQFTAAQSDSKNIEIDVTSFYNAALAENEDKITFAVTANTNASDFWLTSKEGGTGVNAARAPRLLAEVEKDPDYMVTYDLNGGQGTAPIQSTLDAGAKFAAAKGTGITGPDGKQFAEWNTKADGTGDSYRAGDEVTMPAANLTLYAVYKTPVTITPNAKTVILTDNTVDLSTQGLFTIDANAGRTQTYSVLSGGTGKGRVDKTDGKTLTVSRFGTIRIKVVTSETDTHMKGEAIVVFTAGKVAVKAESTKLFKEETMQAEIVTEPENIISGTVTWSSSDEGVATVDQNGLITAIAAGSARITAALSKAPGIAPYIDITVEEPSSSDKLLKDRIDELKAEIANLKEAPEKLKELQEAIKELQDKTANMSDLEDKVNKLDGVTGQIEELQEKISDLDNKADKDAIAGLQSQISGLQEQISDLDEKADAAEITRLEGLITDLQNKIKDNEWETKIGLIDELKTSVDTLNTQAEAIEKLDLEQKLQELATLQSDMEALQNKVNNLPSDTDKKLETLTSQLSELQDKVDKIPDLSDEVAGLQDELKAVSGIVSKIDADTINAEIAKISGIQAQIEVIQEQTDKIADLQIEVAKIKTMESEISKLKETAQKVAALEAEIKRLEGQTKELAATKAEAERVAKLEAELLKMQQEKAEAEALIKKIQEQLLNLENTVKANAEGKAALKAGDTITSGKVKYRVTNAKKKLAEAYGAKSKSQKSVTIAATVKIKGVTLKVTSVADNAFKGMSKLQKVTVGKNVTAIGKNAFAGDRKLNKVVIKSKNLKKVGSAALKNISSKAEIKVPSGMKAKYTRLLKGKGQSKNVKVK
ncbi:MAG: DNRLRE domain-containing protein [Eubacterium sp.]|nr:DNRLRE domain-containing protein [Eubacterium sp.]